jgi:hypothetical protein
MTHRWALVAAIALAACGSPADAPAPAPAPTGACGSTDALWAASDYSSSAVGALALTGSITAASGAVDLGSDPVLAASRGRAFFVARDEDLVFELDPRCGTPLRRWSVHQPSPSGGSSNPQDVAVASDGSLWVPLYNVPRIVVLDRAGDVSRTIDLSPYDGDGNPNASAIAIVDTPGGEKAFVALERLNDADAYKSEQPSWMLRVDVNSAAVEGHVQLGGRNPFGMFVDDGVLWLAEPGNFDDAAETDAGIERFDTTTSTTALLVRETDLGGSVAEVTVSSGCGAAIVAGPTHNVNPTSLVTFDPATGAVPTPAARSPLATPGFQLQGLVWSAGALLVGDRRRAGSGFPVHAFDGGGGCALQPRGDTIFLPLPAVGLRAP